MVAWMKLLVAALVCLPAVLSRPAEVAKPEAAEPEVGETEVTETEITEPEVAETEAPELEVAETEVAEPEVAEPEATEAPLEFEDERFPRSFSHRLAPTFQARGVREPLVSLTPGIQIPRNTLSTFTPPAHPTKPQREQAYFGNTRFVAPPHAHLVVQNELFFDTFDHAKVILGYEKRRKMARIPPHLLKSLRPYFPFFVLD